MSAEREIPAEDSIKVVCRFRPLNDSEERAGSKFIVKFPNSAEENCLSIGVSAVTATTTTILHPIEENLQNSLDFSRNIEGKKTCCLSLRIQQLLPVTEFLRIPSFGPNFPVSRFLPFRVAVHIFRWILLNFIA